MNNNNINWGSIVSIHSLRGKFVLFLSFIAIIVITFSLNIIIRSHQVKLQIAELEDVREPMADSLSRMADVSDDLMTSVRVRITKHESITEEARQMSWENFQSGLNLIIEKRQIFPEDLQLTIDSMEQMSIRTEELEIKLNAWIVDNYISPSSDSVFIAELPRREQTELKPLVTRLDRGLTQLKGAVRSLNVQNEMAIQTITKSLRQKAKIMLWSGVIGGILLVILLIAGAIYLAISFKRSVDLPISILQKLVEGETSDYVKPTRDEMGEVIDAANKLNVNLQQASAFAQSIGEGNVNFSFKPVSENDLLGNSLVQMRDRLKEINDEDKQRVWVTEGLAKFADVMRSNDNYLELTNTVITELVKYTHSSVGGIFIYDETKNDLNLEACYAYERRKYLTKRIDLGMGLVGQCFLERKTIVLKEVPQGYLTITSGLGGSQPRCLLLVPLLVNESIEGVLELASFKEYNPYEVEFVEKVAEIIASTIINVRVSERTKRLLEDSQSQSEQMRAQEEEMRQNMEEMQATQEQMQRQADETKKIQMSLEMEKLMFHALMDYLPDRVTYKDLNSVVTRVNKAKASRYQITPEEMIGTTDYDFFDKEHADNAVAEERRIIKEGKPIINEEQRVVLPKTGEVTWSSVSRVPFANAQQQIVGMFVIAKDITELNLAKSSLEDRERIIQQLLNNIEVFRYTISREGTVTNIWKSRALKDVDPSVFANKSVAEVFPNVSDMIRQKDMEDMDLVCKEVMEVNEEEKEIFKHHLFRDSAIEGVFVCFAIRQ